MLFQLKKHNITEQSNEFDLVEKLCERIKKEPTRDVSFLVDYVTNRANWYISHARYNKHCFHWLTVLSTVLPLISASFVAINGIETIFDWLSVIFNLLVSVCGFAIGHFRYHEHWTNYRTTVEKILSEGNLYLGKAGPYSKKGLAERNIDDSTELFIVRFENVLNDERVKWIAGQRKRREEKVETSKDDNVIPIGKIDSVDKSAPLSEAGF